MAYDEKAFFESFYQANVEGEPEDRHTCSPLTELEARFHYNSVENAIIEAHARVSPPPPAAMVAAWRRLTRRRELRHLDVGSGTGHWVDFFREVFLVGHSVAVEITASMADYLRRKYAPAENVTVLQLDVVSDELSLEPVDYVTAVGVMFHLVDDGRWQQALRNLAAVLKPEGLLFVGGEFGAETRDAQFHGSDTFSDWREFEAALAAEGRARVNKRVRSLAHWHRAATACGLEIVDLVRTHRPLELTMPENNVLVLRPSVQA